MTDICERAAKVVNEEGKEGFLKFLRTCTLEELDAMYDTLGIEIELQGGYIADVWGGFLNPEYQHEQRIKVAKGCDEQLARAGW